MCGRRGKMDVRHGGEHELIDAVDDRGDVSVGH